MNHSLARFVLGVITLILLMTRQSQAVIRLRREVAPPLESMTTTSGPIGPLNLEEVKKEDVVRSIIGQLGMSEEEALSINQKIIAENVQVPTAMRHIVEEKELKEQKERSIDNALRNIGIEEKKTIQDMLVVAGKGPIPGSMQFAIDRTLLQAHGRYSRLLDGKLNIYLRSNFRELNMKTVCRFMSCMLEVKKVQPPIGFNVYPSRALSRKLFNISDIILEDALEFDSNGAVWVSVDVTHLIRGIVNETSSQNGLLAISSRYLTAELPGELNAPYLDLKIETTQVTSTNHRSRRGAAQMISSYEDYAAMGAGATGNADLGNCDANDLSKGLCCRKTLTLEFSKIPFLQNIISPRTLDLSYCSGTCHYFHMHRLSYGLNVYLNSTAGGAEKACCSPVFDTRPVKIMYLSESGSVFQKELKDIEVLKCQCTI